MASKNKIRFLVALLCVSQWNQIKPYNFDMRPVVRLNLVTLPAIVGVVSLVQGVKSFVGKNRYKEWCLASEKEHLRFLLQELEKYNLKEHELYGEKKAELERVEKKHEKVLKKIVRTEKEYNDDMKKGFVCTALAGGACFVGYKLWNLCN